jgi:hypothetical protein
MVHSEADMFKIISLLILALFSLTAEAYVGPGAGISVLGSLLGILATIVVAIGAIILWPVRKMMKRKKAAAAAAETASADTSSAEQ